MHMFTVDQTLSTHLSMFVSSLFFIAFYFSGTLGRSALPHNALIKYREIPWALCHSVTVVMHKQASSAVEMLLHHTQEICHSRLRGKGL